MDVLTLDMETYYDRDYSLSKMTTEEYIRDERFEVIGVSVKRNDEPGQWFSGDMAETRLWLHRYDWENSVAVAHNAMFDMAIVNWKFGIRPKKIACTLAMARAIDGPDAGVSLAKTAERHGVGEKGNDVISALGMRRHQFYHSHLAAYGRYCVNDGALSFKLFEKFAPLLPKSELNLIDLTVRMFTEPVLKLDTGVLTKHLSSVRSKKEALLAKVTSADRSVLMSNPKLAELLVSMGVRPPTKVSPTTGDITHAFAKSDHEFKALLEHPNEAVQAVVAARLGVKSTLEETRTERLIGVSQRGALPIALRYYAAHTGRWGGDDKSNWQNVPRGSPIKAAVEAPEGHVIIDGDSSQIEARLLAWLAGQWDLVEIFEKNNEEIAAGVPKKEMVYDPYRVMASQIFGVDVSAVTDAQRFIGKWTLLGCGYGMGAYKYQIQLKAQGVDLALSECNDIVDTYRRTYPMIPKLWRQGNRVLHALIEGMTTDFGYHEAVHVDLLGIRLPNQMYLRYPNLREEPNGQNVLGKQYVYDGTRGKAKVPKDIWGGTVTENVCQALARIVVGEQMLMINRVYRPVITVHDSLGFVAPDRKKNKARAFIEACMRIPPKWATGLPLNCETKMGASYGG